MPGASRPPLPARDSSRDQEAGPPARTVQRGAPSEASFEDRYPGWYRFLVGYFLNHVDNNAALADELAAATLVRIWRRVQDGSEPGTPRYVARHVLDNYRQRLQRERQLVLRLAAQPVASAPDPAMLVDERDDRSRALLGALSPTDRESPRLVSVVGLSLAEAAAMLRCSRGTFAVRLHRARAALRRELAPGDARSLRDGQSGIAEHHHAASGAGSATDGAVRFLQRER